MTNHSTPQSIIKKNLTGKTFEAFLFSRKHQLVHIKITTLVNTKKFSLWTEINQGDNSIKLNTQDLMPGTYKITVYFPEENTREEIFNIA